MKINTSLSTRLIYSFMLVVGVIILILTMGISFLVTNYIHTVKEEALAAKGHDVAHSVEYFIEKRDKQTLHRYLATVDKLVGARVWLYDDAYNLLDSSLGKDSLQYTSPTEAALQGALARYTKEENEHKESPQGRELYQQLHGVLEQVYLNGAMYSSIFHPYNAEQLFLVGIPYINPLNKRIGVVVFTEPLHLFKHFLENIYGLTIVIGIIALLLSLVAVKYLTNTVVDPLVKMKDLATYLAKGDYNRRISIKGDDEVAQLGHALNILGDDLGKYDRRMLRLDRIRRSFITNVSHELRTPLTIIRGYNSAIADGLVKDSTMAGKYHATINNEVSRLENIVHDLLEVSRFQDIESLPKEDKEPIPMDEFLGSIADQLGERTEDIKVEFALHGAENIKILGNGDYLAQLMIILGDNALKYSPKNGTVSLDAYKLKDGSAVIAVTDQGPGIPQKELPFIWERFYKVEQSHCRKDVGSGLGLTIAKEIIRIHGASAQVLSKCGQGTTFEIKFPKDKVV